jgi:hypothetical protein
MDRLASFTVSCLFERPQFAVAGASFGGD